MFIVAMDEGISNMIIEMKKGLTISMVPAGMVPEIQIHGGSVAWIFPVIYVFCAPVMDVYTIVMMDLTQNIQGETSSKPMFFFL